ncbi:helix-turn-helix domain-containing protein [Amaricoccus macauensis]|uniref:helix-turn-helix domain-containing protein n=1 Tax=Amaricoccus macauensis TaxID=57001 RepID=UPI003C7B164F
MPTIKTEEMNFPSGGCNYSFCNISLGIFRADQPTHHFSCCSSKADHKPVEKYQGWILPAGTSGVCEFDDQHEITVLSIDPRLFEEAGMPRNSDFRPVLGDIHPLAVQLALNSKNFAGQGRLYKETMDRALVVQLQQMLGPASIRVPDLDDLRLRRAVDFIHDNLSEDLSLTGMANVAGMSPTHFAKAFKKAMNLSPLKYVILQRMEVASVLLRTTKLIVAEIAWRVGYGDVSRFTQHFKRQFGATPAAYRVG